MARDLGFEEEQFKAFMIELLSAEAYDSSVEEQMFFSFDMLRQILGKFCHIIARNLRCDSCTVNLQLYDPLQVDEATRRKWIKEHLDRQKVYYSSDFERFRVLREKMLTDHMTFPYWRHGKGVSLLVAANPCGPWTSVLHKGEEGLKYISLESGVTLDIYQENTARVRDRLNMRGTRYLGKLGRADIVVWNNLDWHGIFKSYYGVPIRIHSDGEVVGLLKVENKQDRQEKGQNGGVTDAKPSDESFFERLLSSRPAKDFVGFNITLQRPGKGSILSEIGKRCGSKNEIDDLNVSLLSLAYLRRDVEAGDSSKPLREYLLLPYPQAIAEAVKCLETGVADALKEVWDEEKKKTALDTTNVPGLCAFLKEVLARRAAVLGSNWPSLRRPFEVFLFAISERKELVEENRDQPPRVKDLKDLDTSWSDNPKDFPGRFVALLEEVEKRYSRIISKDYSSLLLDSAPRPADDSHVQIFFTDIDGEHAFWKALMKMSPRDKSRDYIVDLFQRVDDFYTIVSSVLRDSIHYVVAPSKGSLVETMQVENRSALDEVVKYLRKEYPRVFPEGATVRPWYEENSIRVDFCYQLATNFANRRGGRVYLYACVPPTMDDMKRFEEKNSQAVVARMYTGQLEFICRPSGMSPVSLREVIQRRTAFLMKWDNDDGKKWIHFCQGEQHCFHGVDGFSEPSPLRITDLLHDRLAARIQAFATACPVEEFDPEDTHKLTWAAFEIGKLVERQIAYRGNKSRDPMPLTTLEFCGIPISDMSFVDNLRRRRAQLKEIGGNIDVYLKDVYSQMGMESDVAYSSRTKEYRSYFERLRERFEAYYRGNIALWAYLLACAVEEDTTCLAESETGASRLAEDQEKFRGDLKKFKESLAEFKKKVENLCPPLREKLRLEMTDLYGDLKFDAPPFLDGLDRTDESLLWEAVDRITENIAKETDQLDLSFARYCQANEDKMGKIDALSSYISEHADAFERILFRDYSYFSRDALSLFLQLANRLLLEDKYLDAYVTLYRHCHELRNSLCRPASEMRDTVEGRLLANVFDLHRADRDEIPGWQTIYKFISTYRTAEVFRLEDHGRLPSTHRTTKALARKDDDVAPSTDKTVGVPPSRDRDLFLRPAGIYKRIRTLRTVLKRQHPASILDWELGRFDLYGTRVNCLFKNQVFAIYEDLWNKGDPFFHFILTETNADRFVQDPAILSSESGSSRHDAAGDGDAPQKQPTCEPSKHRKRWLCLRTNVSSDGYTSVHIAALVDPAFTKDGYWEDEGRYNLRKVQHVMGRLFSKFESKEANHYCQHAFHRHMMGRQYVNWYRDYQSLLRGTKPEKAESKWSGSFLFEGIFDLLMMLIDAASSTIRGRGDRGRGDRYGLHRGTIELITKGLTGETEGFAERLVAESIRKRLLTILEGVYRVCLFGGEYARDIRQRMCDAGVLAGTPFCCKPSEKSREDGLPSLEDVVLAHVICEMDVERLLDYYQVPEDRKKTERTRLADVQGRLKGEKKLEGWTWFKETLRKEKGKYRDTDWAQIRAMDTDKARRITGMECTQERQSSPDTKPDAVWDRPCGEENDCALYRLAENSIEDLEGIVQGNEWDRDVLKLMRENLAKEKAFFLTLRSSQSYHTPLFFSNWTNLESQDLLSLVRLRSAIIKLSTSKRGLLVDNGLQWLEVYRAIRHIRREQKSYLFAQGSKDEKAGLWLRDKANVLSRLKNYTLLFSRDDPAPDTQAMFAGWNAHDLYYYLRSLIPVEIQVRTKLVDTFAEQYHDAVYKKKTPPSGTELPRVNMIGVGNSIDRADRELEIDYEDYALRFE